MRLFIAVEFSEEIKARLYSLGMNLKEQSRFGNFTRRENIHLTLAFIGQSDRARDIQKVMDLVSLPPFELTISRAGRFKRFGKDIYWLGVDKNDQLRRVSEELNRGLASIDIKTDHREFKPHLTLGREVVMEEGFSLSEFSKSIGTIRTEVSKISLMKSERLEGKLTYSCIYEKHLI